MLFLPKSLNFIYFTTITKQVYNTTYINHARWHRCLRSDGLRVGGNRTARRKPTCLTWWLFLLFWAILTLLFVSS